MKDRPILFSGPMVCALLNGRKTMTRRVMNPQPVPNPLKPGSHYWSCAAVRSMVEVEEFLQNKNDPSGCGLGPFGWKGDRLWVRETWRIAGDTTELKASTSTCKGPEDVQFRATPPDYVLEGQKEIPSIGWRPSIFMPRWASRISLEITDVRCERLHEISASDCVCEGMPIETTNGSDRGYIRLFRDLWETLNKARGFGWDVNPWVWVVSFKKL